MCNAALKPKQYKQKTYCNKNGRGEFIIPCIEVNVCTGLLFSYNSYHCVVMKSVVPHNLEAETDCGTNRENLKLLE